MPEQVKVDDIIILMKEKGISLEEIIRVLSDIIKAQMLTGGSLEEKLNYYKVKFVA